MDQVVGNGVLAEDGNYAIGPVSLLEFASRIRGERIKGGSSKAPLPHLQAESLDQVGWGVVTAEADERAEAKLAALEPLLALRRGQASVRFRGDLFRRLGEGARNFLGRYRVGPGPVENLPYYLLLVGSAHDIPFAFQHDLAHQFAVGRLDFDDVESYAHYAENVIKAARGEISRDRKIDFFATRHAGDLPTEWSNRDLIDPVVERLSRETSWTIGRISGHDATKNRLQALLGQSEALLFTSTHGVLFGSQSPSKKLREGALLCADWSGPGHDQPVGKASYLAAEDLHDDVDLRGLVTFHFACNSAGTPRLDSYTRYNRQEKPAIEAETDFVAALPKRMLGLEKGALAVIGHADGVWPWSYRWSNQTRDIGHFVGLFHQLVAGKRIGHALAAFGERSATIAANIVRQQDDERAGTADSGDPLTRAKGQVFLWTAHQDARSYVLLGDPAVRLALGNAEDGI